MPADPNMDALTEYHAPTNMLPDSEIAFSQVDLEQPVTASILPEVVFHVQQFCFDLSLCLIGEVVYPEVYPRQHSYIVLC